MEIRLKTNQKQKVYDPVELRRKIGIWNKKCVDTRERRQEEEFEEYRDILLDLVQKFAGTKKGISIFYEYDIPIIRKIRTSKDRRMKTVTVRNLDKIIGLIGTEGLTDEVGALIRRNDRLVSYLNRYAAI